jgi:hypothetical protein
MKNNELESCEQVPFVFANSEWIPLKSTEFLNVEEGLQGEDIITFNYEGKTYKSKIILKYK